MTPPLYTVEPAASRERKATVNLLPCRIHHDGDVNTSDTFWKPTKTQESKTQTAYLRGRKLYGKPVIIPEGYYGMVVEKTDAKPQATTEREGVQDEDVQIIEDPDDQLAVGAMEGKATFDELMIWGHESTSDSSVDPYIRGMEEWIAFSAKIHSFDMESNPTK